MLPGQVVYIASGGYYQVASGAVPTFSLQNLGYSGANIPVGSTVATGYISPAGIAGYTGVTGAQGIQGSPGVTGATGPQGSPGVTGATGPQGSPGVTGATGPQGSPGVTGVTGAPGINAYSESYGFTQPAVGAALAVQVPSGNWLQPGQIVYIASGGYYQVASGSVPTFSLQNLGYSGVNLPVGSTVATGYISPAGIAGYTGVTGAQGIQGSPGVTGATGPQGSPGVTGATGPQGSPGVTGVTGAPGINAYSESYGFTQPAVGAAIAIQVPSGQWMQPGQHVFIGSGGYYQVASGSVPTFSLQNLGFSGSNIPVGSTVATGFVSPAGYPGVTGATGVQGIQGSPGVTGATGPQGSPGVTGATGPQGSPGVTGSPGINAYSESYGFTQPSVGAAIAVQIPSGYWLLPGQVVYIASGGYYQVASGSAPTFSLQNLGYSGVNLPVGSTIATGFISPAGIAGYTGVTGAQGIQGSPGVTGATGPQGSPGVTGAQGIQGSPGVTGATGPQGSPGVTGVTGAPGINAYSESYGFTQPAVGAALAVQVPSGYWLLPGQVVYIASGGYYQVASGSAPTFSLQNLGYSGANIPVGSTVATGYISPAGIAGYTGATGVQGIQGSPGVTGATGPQGSPGVTGSQGIQGSPGVTGATGPQGSPGVTGAQGIQGSPGVTGAQGIQGSPGVTGATGPQGSPGVTGVTGAPGINAYSTTYGFTQPAVGAAIAIQVPSGYWIQPGQRVFIASGGSYQVASGAVPTFSLLNLGYSGVNIPVGSTVATGTISPDGVAGVTGVTGVQGIQGSPGVTGATGPQGSPGVTGAQGIQGSPGVTGATGPQGSPGVTGAGGINAYSESYGFTQPSVGAAIAVQVPSGYWLLPGQVVYIASGGYYQVSSGAVPTFSLQNLGYSGVNLPVGSTIATGYISPAGIAGYTGVTGAQGQQGSPGVTGATGPQGSPGVTGPQGPQGSPGVTGPAGSSSGGGGITTIPSGYISPLLSGHVLGDNFNAAPSGAGFLDTYLVASGATGGWTGLSGHLLQFGFSAVGFSGWTDITGSIVQAGQMFVVGATGPRGNATGYVPTGSFARLAGQIVQMNSNAPGASYTFNTPTSGVIAMIAGANDAIRDTLEVYDALNGGWRSILIAPATATGAGSISALNQLNLNSMNGTVPNASGSTITVFRPGDYSLGNTFDPTGTLNSTTSFQAMMNAVNAYNNRCIVELPPGVFIVNTGVLNFTSVQPQGIIGKDRGMTVLIPGNATGDMITFATGMDGGSVRNLAIYQTGTPQTAGNGININGANDILIENCLFVNLFTDIFIQNGSIKVDVTHTYHSQTNGASGSIGILVANGAAGDTYLGPDIVMSNTGAQRRFASVVVNQSGHFEINQCNLTGSNQGLIIAPTGTSLISFGFINGTLFDSCTVNGASINATASGTVKSIKFVNSWFSGTIASTGGAGFVSTGAPGATVDGVSFDTCRYLNNQGHGAQHGFGNGFEWIGCDFRGNSQAGAGLSDGLNLGAGVSNWRVLGGKFGGSDSGETGINQRWGINVATGTSTNASIMGADLSGNLFGPLNNAISTGTFYQQGCLGMPQVPAPVAQNKVLNTTGTYVTQPFYFPTGALQAGSEYVCQLDMTSTGTSQPTVLVKFGVTGTMADPNLQIMALPTGSTASGAAKISVRAICKSIGTATTNFCTSIEVVNNGVSGFMGASSQFATVPSAGSASGPSNFGNYLGVAIVESGWTGVHAVQNASWTPIGPKQ
jgi:hypothetical protein